MTEPTLEVYEYAWGQWPSPGYVRKSSMSPKQSLVTYARFEAMPAANTWEQRRQPNDEYPKLHEYPFEGEG